MPEFWHKSKQRGMETLALWRRFMPGTSIGSTTPAAHAEDIAALDSLAQAVATARTHVRAAKQAELASFGRIRTVNLAVPQLIAGQFDPTHPVRAGLSRVYAVTPESDPTNLHRGRLLIPVWRSADAAMSALHPGAVICRGGLGVEGFAQWLAEYPAALQATADAVGDFRMARTALRAQHRKVDGLNKRAYRKFTAEARSDAALKAALHAGITREPSTWSRRGG